MRLMTGMARPPSSDDVPLAQARDVGVAVAEFAQDLLGVLAGLGAGGREPAWRPAQRHRLPDQFEAAERLVLNRLGDPEMPDLGIGEHLVDRIDWPGRHPGIVEALDPFRTV